MAATTASQNIYDNDPAFYAKFVELRESRPETQQTGVPDMATLHELLPPLRGKRVLDLGSGDGWFCRWASARGAAACRGVDVSAVQRGRARQLTDMHRAYLLESRGDGGAGVRYVGADLNQRGALAAALEEVEGPEDEEEGAGAGAVVEEEKQRRKKKMKKFQVAFSSLALHYVVDLKALLEEVSDCLAPGAFFFFSIEHPMATAPRVKVPQLLLSSDAEEEDDDEKKPVWPLRDYLAEGERVKTWLGADVAKRHHTVSSYVNALAGSGFDVVGCWEWGIKDGGEGGSIDHMLRERNYGVTESVFPYFMGFKVWKR